MADEGFEPYGVDFSSEGINYTKKLLCDRNNQEYIENMIISSATSLPFQDNFFDGIICYGVLVYLDFDDIKIALSEIKRVLKPEGKLFLTVRGIEDYRYDCRCDEIEKNTIIVNTLDENRCAYSENNMLMHFFTEEELRELFIEFKNVNVDYMKETHKNQEYFDYKYFITAEK